MKERRLLSAFSQSSFQTFNVHIISYADTSQSNLAFIVCSGCPERVQAESRTLQLIPTCRTAPVPPHRLILTFSSLSAHRCILLHRCQLKKTSGFLGECQLPSSSVSRNEKKVLKICFPSSLALHFTFLFFFPTKGGDLPAWVNLIPWPLSSCLYCMLSGAESLGDLLQLCLQFGEQTRLDLNESMHHPSRFSVCHWMRVEYVLTGKEIESPSQPRAEFSISSLLLMEGKQMYGPMEHN